MQMPKLFSNLVLTALLLFSTLGVATDASAQTERILRFRSDIVVNEDASLTVTETIRVQSAQRQIKRGIYRDLPRRVQFRDILRDGKPDDYHTESTGFGTRLYIGRESHILPIAIYTYSITYDVPREVRFFKAHDEVYWNVTGNEWGFPIDRAIATVRLPADVDEDDLTVEGYTGKKREKGQDYTAGFDAQGNPYLETTRMLEANEGLSIVVIFPKGIVTQPSFSEKVAGIFFSNPGDTIALSGLLVAVVYFSLMWILVGRDPASGRILPVESPPKGISPAAARYISQMGYDSKIFTVAIVDMAVKGYLRIEQEEDKTYVLVRGDADEEVLTPEEAGIARTLLGSDELVELKQANHAKLSKAIQDFQKALKRKYASEYFVTNAKYLLPGMLLSGIFLVLGALAQPGAELSTVLFFMAWLTGWSIGVFALVTAASRAWRTFLTGPLGSTIGPAIGWTVLLIPFAGGELLVLFVLAQASSPTLSAVLFATVLLLFVFYQLLKAPTLLGRRVMDKIEGFEMYLNGEGSHRLAGSADADRTARFEAFLPYAIALGKETEWSEEFDQALTTSPNASTTHYYPGWYSGQDFSSAGIRGFGNSFGSSFSTAITSASMSPSSGSGGGGFSGGGGGGGGGGGW